MPLGEHYRALSEKLKGQNSATALALDIKTKFHRLLLILPKILMVMLLILMPLVSAVGRI